MCPANLACRADSRIPASDPALRIPACELPSRTAPASPGERTRLAIPPCEPRRAVPPCELPRRTPTSDPAIRAISVWACSRRPSPYTGRRASPLRSVRQNAREVRSQRLVVARFRRGACSGGDPWQDFAVVCSRTLGDGKMLAKCVFRRLAVARYRSDAFPKGPLTGKCQFVARYCRHVSKMSWFWQDSRAMHPKIAAKRRSGMHHAKILP